MNLSFNFLQYGNRCCLLDWSDIIMNKEKPHTSFKFATFCTLILISAYIVYLKKCVLIKKALPKEAFSKRCLVTKKSAKCNK